MPRININSKEFETLQADDDEPLRLRKEKKDKKIKKEQDDEKREYDEYDSEEES